MLPLFLLQQFSKSLYISDQQPSKVNMRVNKLFPLELRYMIFIYVLFNDFNNEWYTGMTQDISNRLKEHNQGKNRYTKAFIPWRLLYYEEAQNWKAGRIREKYLKSSAGKKWLKKKLQM